MDWVRDLPLIPAIAVLWVIVLLRAGGTYALARGAHRLARRGRLEAMLSSARVARAIDVVNRWGAPFVALSFLTVGVQTAANAAAGLTRMPLRRYLPALAIGGLAWATIYATVGLTVLYLWLDLFLRSPWAAVAALLVVVGVLALVIVRRRRAARSADRSLPRSDDPSGRTP